MNLSVIEIFFWNLYWLVQTIWYCLSWNPIKQDDHWLWCLCELENDDTYFFLILCGQYLWLCFQFQKLSHNQKWQNKRQTPTDISQKMKMLILPLGHVKSIHDFICASMTVITTKFGRIIDQHGITLSCRWWWHYYYSFSLLTNKLCRVADEEVMLNQQVTMKLLPWVHNIEVRRFTTDPLMMLSYLQGKIIVYLFTILPNLVVKKLKK